MRLSDDYELFKSSAELPQFATNQLSDFFLHRFSGKLEHLFVELARDFPNTFASIDSNFGPPCIGIKTIVGRKNKKIDLLFQAEDRCLVGDLYTRNFYDLYDLAEIYKMLPDVMRSYYQVTEGLQIVPESGYPGLAWKDLPLSRIRMSLVEAAEFLNLDSDYFKSLPASVNTKVWMMSDSDLLLVDEDTRCFYHCDVAQPDNLFELKRPEKAWDDYCAHILSKNEIGNFDFRRI